MSSTPHRDFRSEDPQNGKATAAKTALPHAILLIAVALGLFFALLEGGLALFGVEPAQREEDPFVGFAGNAPLFDEIKGPDGQVLLTTASGKLKFFNRQQFPKEKDPRTYRIFCMGGSTTYGHPYNDLTSFAGWLRELLPEADRSRNWEVINAGGISYASYRVTRLMEELAAYQPDLFLVYTGQNEFLEERTYGSLRDIPEVVRDTAAVLSKTRTWTAMTSVLTRAGALPQQSAERQQLSAEVDAVLDHSAGLERYHRDDALRDDVLHHFRLSLERMVEIAQQAGAQVIFVTPASNLKDCSPFKSEHSPGLDENGKARVKTLLASASERLRANDAPAALVVLDQALALDPRNADLHFQRGRTLFAMARFEEALGAFERARDEDVCPLRALTPIPGIVAEVARSKGAPLVDFLGLVTRQLQMEKGHRIPGEEWFMDHVHPTVAGNRLLAVALVDEMTRAGIVHAGATWPAEAIAAASARIETRIDPYEQARSLVNLTKTLHWARKFEDARRAARQALALSANYPHYIAQLSDALLKMALEESDAPTAERFAREAIAADPRNVQNRLELALHLLRQERKAEGMAHILLSAALWDKDSQANSLLGQVLFETRRYEQAYPYLKKSLALNPGDGITQLAFTKLRNRLGADADGLPLSAIEVRWYASKSPREIFLVDPEQPGRRLPHGFLTEWFEDGNLKRYAEFHQGVPDGVDLQWAADGRLVSRLTYQQGRRAGG